MTGWPTGDSRSLGGLPPSSSLIGHGYGERGQKRPASAWRGGQGSPDRVHRGNATLLVGDVVAPTREVLHLETDGDVRRLGELGAGMNHGSDRVTDNVLFDEKKGDTVQLVLGRPYDSNLPE
jgi:hypothetical protein